MTALPDAVPPGPLLAVDPGEKFIGVAVSDPNQRLARPLTVLKHENRLADARRLAALAHEQRTVAIVVGQATDVEGRPTTLQARRARNLARTLRRVSGLPVYLWDETGTSQQARALWALTRRRGRHRERVDAAAAALLLQDFLDHLHPPEAPAQALPEPPEDGL